MRFLISLWAPKSLRANLSSNPMPNWLRLISRMKPKLFIVTGSDFKFKDLSAELNEFSIHLEELNGFPGPYMKDMWKHFTPQELGIKFAGSRISAICRLGLCRGEGNIVIAEGRFDGDVIAPKNNEHKGRFFELCVQIDGTDKSMFEYSPEEKNEFSHRGKAIKKLIEILKKEKKQTVIQFHLFLFPIYYLYKNFHLPRPAIGGSPALKIFSKIPQRSSFSLLIVFKREEYLPILCLSDILKMVA